MNRTLKRALWSAEGLIASIGSYQGTSKDGVVDLNFNMHDTQDSFLAGQIMGAAKVVADIVRDPSFVFPLDEEMVSAINQIMGILENAEKIFGRHSPDKEN
jgi:hypothetical protein